MQSPGIKLQSLQCSAAQDWEPRRTRSGLGGLGMEGMAGDAGVKNSRVVVTLHRMTIWGLRLGRKAKKDRRRLIV